MPGVEYDASDKDREPFVEGIPLAGMVAMKMCWVVVP